MFYWFLKWIALGPLLRVVFRPQTEGAEHVPAEGPAILASNHLSYADWLFMPLTLPRRVTFVAKAEYFTGKGLKGWLQKTFFSGSGQVPIDRAGADAAAGALLSAKRVLGEGGLFGIYPEGTRSHDGKLYRGKTGVARLALETGVPVIPVAVVGLPGAVTETVPPAREVQCSSMTARVVSPAIFLAIAGRPAVFCTWSLTRVKPSSVGVRSMSWETTPWASQTFARKAGSASIAKTSSGGAS